MLTDTVSPNTVTEEDRMRVDIPGYLDGWVPPVDPSVLVGATAWLDDPVIWPALLYSMGGSPTSVEAFDVDPADVDVRLNELMLPDRWPVFTVGLLGGHRLLIVWRNFEDEEGCDYLLQLDGPRGRTVEIASLEGHFRGPAWPWREMLALARQPDQRLTTGERLLLLLPALGDADLPADAVGIVAEAVTTVGGRRRQEDVARELLAASGRFWGAVEWTERDGVPYCVGGHSLRNGSPRLIAEAFAGRGASR